MRKKKLYGFAIALAATSLLISGVSADAYAEEMSAEQAVQEQDVNEDAISIENAVVEPIENQVYTGEEPI